MSGHVNIIDSTSRLKEDPNNRLKEECTKVIDYMIKKYDISCQQDSIIDEVWNNIVINNNAPRRKNNLNLPQEERCLGRKADGQQCTRRKKENSCYCGSHIKKLTCGHINDGQIITPREKGKRGRKKKITDSDNRKKYIEAWIDSDLGSNYLIDKNNFVYKNDLEYPELLGFKKGGLFHQLDELPENYIEIS